MNDQEALVLLNALPGVGSVTARRLIEAFGSARSALGATRGQMISSGAVTRSMAEKIFEFDRDNFLLTEYNQIREKAVRVVTIFDEQYPEALRAIHTPPLVLYVRGVWPLDLRSSLAIVGSRRASVYGMSVAEKFAIQLAGLGFTIVSGLAKGIDTAAHSGSLKAGGTTVGVVGCGLSHIYPEENAELYERVSRNGAVVSEFPMTVPPVAANFPARNRIISGLSLATIVVEASLKSGALITSRFALEQGKDVFAVPGPIDHPGAQGVNRLIKDGARIATSVDDILEELTPLLRKEVLVTPQSDSRGLTEASFIHLDEREDRVFQSLETADPVYIDDLARRSGFALKDVAEVLLKLQLKKCVRPLPGKWFVRVEQDRK